jgi:hypothetical protein
VREHGGKFIWSGDAKLEDSSGRALLLLVVYPYALASERPPPSVPGLPHWSLNTLFKTKPAPPRERSRSRSELNSLPPLGYLLVVYWCTGTLHTLAGIRTLLHFVEY